MRSAKEPRPYCRHARRRPAVQRGIVNVVRRQAGAGVDVIRYGEVGKCGFGNRRYYGRRLSGLTTRLLKPGERRTHWLAPTTRAIAWVAGGGALVRQFDA